MARAAMHASWLSKIGAATALAARLMPLLKGSEVPASIQALRDALIEAPTVARERS
jgi:hypothetical protein